MWIAVCIALLMGAAAIWRSRNPVRRVSAPQPFRAVTAVEQNLERTLRVTGQMMASKAATFVAPKMRGSRRRSSGDFRLILQDVLPPGARVRKGDAVAKFDPLYMLNRVDDERADVEERKMINRRIDASTDIRRTQLEQRIRVAEANLEKAQLNLKTIPVRSAIAAERFRLQEEEARARLRELHVQRDFFDQSERSQLRREELALLEVTRDLERAQANVDLMTFRTPIDGVVIMGQTQRGSDMGEIEAGDEVRSGHAFMQVMDLNSLYLEAIANQVDEGTLRPGARAVIRLDAVTGVEIPGRVTTVGAMATANRYRPAWVRHFAVRIVPDRLEHRAYPNFTGSADIVTASERGLTIPRECVHRERGRDVVDLVRRGPEGEVTREPRVVQLGLASNTRVVVRSGIGRADALACP